MAVASLVCGILGYLVLPGLLGIIFDVIAIRQINGSAGAIAGNGLAVGGLFTSGLDMITGIFGFLLVDAGMQSLKRAIDREMERVSVEYAEADWGIDLPAALEAAAPDKQNVLLDFTGSDWCPPCMALHRQVLATKPFADYAKDNLKLVMVDFPQSKP